MFNRLNTHKRKHGNCNLSSDNALARWVAHQRSKKDEISEERRERLNSLGLVWTPFDHAWQKGFFALETFRCREGHCRVPEIHFEGPYNLGAWAKEQRRKKDVMDSERRQRLNAIGFWRNPARLEA
jgi:hypothetical protein